ncbi:MAG: hypothetical protein WCX65_06530 [bacterium]
MRVIRFSLLILSIIFLFSNLIYAQTLYEKRQAIEKQYYLQQNNQSKGDIHSSIDSIDLEYRRQIFSLLLLYENNKNKSNVKSINSKCSSNKDPVINNVCNWIVFKLSHDSNNFIRKADANNPQALWTTDGIIMPDIDKYGLKIPKLFEDKDGNYSLSFVDIYIDDIFKLALKGNDSALLLLNKLFESADGYYGEAISYDLGQIFIKNKKLVLKHWKKVRKNYCGGVSELEGDQELINYCNKK